MKILHLAVVGGENRGGGVHEVTHHYYKHQRRLGISPALWFPGNDEEYNAPQKLDSNKHQNKVIKVPLQGC
jgi:hypothetical protein